MITIARPTPAVNGDCADYSLDVVNLFTFDAISGYDLLSLFLRTMRHLRGIDQESQCAFMSAAVFDVARAD